MTDANGNYVLFEYDAAGDLVRSYDRDATSQPGFNPASPGSQYTGTSYGTTANPWRYVTATQDAVGNVTSYTLNANGWVTRMIDPDNAARRAALSNPAFGTDATTYGYDAGGDRTMVKTPLETDDAGKVDDSAARAVYDVYGNLIAVKDPDGAWTEMAYDAVNRMTDTFTDRGKPAAATDTVTNPDGTTVTVGATSCPTTGTHSHIPAGDAVCDTSTSYDMADDVLTQTDATGATTSYTYDGRGKTLTVSTPRDANTSLLTRASYDADGNTVLTCAPMSVGANPASPTACSTSNPYAVFAAYDQQDRVITASQYRAAPTVHAPVVGPAASSPGAPLTASRTFTAAGEVASTVDPRGTSTTYLYDTLQRLTTVDTPRDSSTTLATGYTYDPSGNELSETDPVAYATGTGTKTLTVDGSNYPSSAPYVLTGSDAQYQSITLTNGGTLLANPRQLLQVQGTLSICSTCAIYTELGSNTGGAYTPKNTAGASGAGTGAGSGGATGVLAGGGGGGGSHAGSGGTGTTATAGGTGGVAGPTYPTSGEQMPSTSDFGSGGGAGGGSMLNPGGGGGYGGGALHIIAGSIIDNGVIAADGTPGGAGTATVGVTSAVPVGGGSGGGGSGGLVWLSASKITLAASTSVRASGGAGGTAAGTAAGGAGAAGYVHLDTPSLTGTAPAGATVTTGNPTITAYSYDADNRVLDTVDGSTSTSAAGAGGAGVAGSNGDSNVRTRVEYDPDGLVTATWTPDAFRSSVTSPDDAYEQITAYDADNRPTTVYQPRFSAAVTEPTAGADATQCPAVTSSSPADYQNVSSLHVCVTLLGYDADGQTIAQRFPTSTDTTSSGGIDPADPRQVDYAYTPDNLLATVTAPNPASDGHRITEETDFYDGVGRPVASLDANGAASTTSYTFDGLTSQTASVGYQDSTGIHEHVSTYGYDLDGEQTTSSAYGAAPAGSSPLQVTTTAYDSDGSVFDSASGDGNTSGDNVLDVTSYGYDPDGNTVAVWAPSANSYATRPAITGHTANTNTSNAVGSPDANYARTGLFYDGSDATSGGGTITATTNAATTYTFTLDNLAQSESQPVELRNPAATGSDSLTAQRTNTWSYDGEGRKTAASVTDQTVNYANGAVSSTATVDGGTQGWSYYPDGQVSQADGRDGATTRYAYEPAGGMTSAIRSSAATDSTTSTTASSMTADFYLDGSARTVTTDGASTAYSYDGLGSESTVTQTPTGGTASTLTTSYGDAETPVAVNAAAYGVGTVTNTFDTLGRTTKTTWSAGNEALSQTWEPDSTLTEQTLTGGSSTLEDWKYVYDGADRQTAISVSPTPGASAPTPSCAGSSQTAAGTTSTAGVSCYGYDTAGRITGYDDELATRTISYDHDSNRTAYTPNSTAISATIPSVSQTYRADDAVATTTTTTSSAAGANPALTSTYTPFGGLAADGCATYAYDGYDEQTDAQTISSLPAACGPGYNNQTSRDALGRAETRTDSTLAAAGNGNTATATTTVNAYDGTSGEIASETTTAASGPGQATGTVRYADSPAGALAAANGSSSQALVWDPDGNLIAAATTTGTTSGTLACGLRYDPFGGAVHVASGEGTGALARQQCTNPGGATLSDLRYQGAQQDPGSGNYHQGDRVYQPGTDRWTTPDMADATTGDSPQSIGVDPLTRNTYDYVNGDPLNLSDPSGHKIPDGGGGFSATPQTVALCVAGNADAGPGCQPQSSVDYGNLGRSTVDAASNALDGLQNALNRFTARLSVGIQDPMGPDDPDVPPVHHDPVPCKGKSCNLGPYVLGFLGLLIPGGDEEEALAALADEADNLGAAAKIASEDGGASTAGDTATAGDTTTDAPKGDSARSKPGTSEVSKPTDPEPATAKAPGSVDASTSGGTDSAGVTSDGTSPQGGAGYAAEDLGAYRAGLQSRPAVGSGASREFQVAHAGATEYRISGGGEQVWADSVDAESGQAVEAKFVGDASSSPFVPGSSIPDFVRSKILAGQESEFYRYGQVISDPGNPLTALQVITNHPGAGDYFGGLMQRFGIPGDVSVFTEVG